MRARAHLQGNPPSAHHPQGHSPGSRELITSQDISIPHHQDVPSGGPRQSASGPAAADVLHSRRAARHWAICSEPRAGPHQGTQGTQHRPPASTGSTTSPLQAPTSTQASLSEAVFLVCTRG